jgi:adenylate kinase family enzyme
MLNNIIEVIGPAGSGKTTLAKAISNQNNVEVITSPPYYKRLTNLPFFAQNTIELLPLLIRLYSTRKVRGLKMRDVAWMVTINGWSQILLQKSRPCSIVILDEGPIYYMAYLQIFGAESMNSLLTQAWWAEMYRNWSKVLDMVIMLDAPDTFLIDRIRAREKHHGVKTKSDDYAHRYLANLREKYENLLIKLTSEECDLRILRFNTQQLSIDEIVSKVINSI